MARHKDAVRCINVVFQTDPQRSQGFGLNIFISFLQLYKHINIYVNNTSYGIRTEVKSL